MMFVCPAAHVLSARLLMLRPFFGAAATVPALAITSSTGHVLFACTTHSINHRSLSHSENGNCFHSPLNPFATALQQCSTLLHACSRACCTRLTEIQASLRPDACTGAQQQRLCVGCKTPVTLCCWLQDCSCAWFLLLQQQLVGNQHSAC